MPEVITYYTDTLHDNGDFGVYDYKKRFLGTVRKKVQQTGLREWQDDDLVPVQHTMYVAQGNTGIDLETFDNKKDAIMLILGTSPRLGITASKEQDQLFRKIWGEEVS